MRREAIDSGAHLGIDLAAVPSAVLRRRGRLLPAGDGGGDRFRLHDADQLLITGYGALLSYFSDAAFVQGLLDVDPLDADALAERLDHITTFFRAALVP